MSDVSGTSGKKAARTKAAVAARVEQGVIAQSVEPDARRGDDTLDLTLTHSADTAESVELVVASRSSRQKQTRRGTVLRDGRSGCLQCVWVSQQH